MQRNSIFKKSYTCVIVILLSSVLNIPCDARPAPAIGIPTKSKGNYADRVGDVYYYTPVVSERERQNGQVATQAFGFKYVACRNPTEVCLAAVDGRGLIQFSVVCSNPCRIVRLGTGETLTYDPGSIVGAALEDAIMGRLVKTTLSGEPIVQSTPEPAPPNTAVP